VNFSFETINTNKAFLQAAIFTFGREDLIPNMFYSLVSELNERFPNTITKLKYYLDRHIEVDGDHHSHLAIEMVEELCGEDKAKWEESLTYIVRSLEQRKKLWDGVLAEIKGL
jgi:pyrroloquinoline quinone (PQQ) biosynthesis protein C